MTDKEFLTMMIEEYGIGDFDDCSNMCQNLLRLVRIELEIREEYDPEDCYKEKRACHDLEYLLTAAAEIFEKYYRNELK